MTAPLASYCPTRKETLSMLDSNLTIGTIGPSVLDTLEP
jgi:hypothetical protein